MWGMDLKAGGKGYSGGKEGLIKFAFPMLLSVSFLDVSPPHDLVLFRYVSQLLPLERVLTFLLECFFKFFLSEILFPQPS